MAEFVEERARLQLRITGRVQGVGFRFSALDEARHLGLTGWVCNTPEGAVDLVAEGPRNQLQRLATWSLAGPPGALVIDVEEHWSAYRGEFGDFRIRH